MPTTRSFKLFQRTREMTGESNLNILLNTMKPKLNDGEFVFCTLKDLALVDLKGIVLLFKEEEAMTIIVKKETADALNLGYSFIASWITLTVYSSLEAVGLTAAFSSALSEGGISCNVVAAFYHDHIFVDRKDAKKAMEILNRFSE
ncbi:MAG TPA: ACT domain-containing protein [Flavisolibacter sp.]|nr:ACT domain-containing protein [Flavisolibacter sp.]